MFKMGDKAIFKIHINTFYYSILWLFGFIIINFIVGYLDLIEMIANFLGVFILTLVLLIKEGGIKYEIKR